MSTIVKYNNDVNKIIVTDGEAEDLKVIVTLLHKLHKKREVTISYGEIRKILDLKNRSLAPIIKKLSKIRKSGFFMYDKEKKILSDISLFERIDYSDEKSATVKLTESAFYLVNELENFTQFNLEEYVKIKTKYSAKLYQLLKQFRSTGFYIVSQQELELLLDSPKGMEPKFFNRDIIKKSVKELEQYFEELNCITIKEGRKTTGYKFTFTKLKDKSANIVSNPESITEIDIEENKKTALKGLALLRQVIK